MDKFHLCFRLLWLPEHLRCNYFCPQFKNFWSQPLWSPEWAWSGSTNSFQGVHPSSPRVGGPVVWRPQKKLLFGGPVVRRPQKSYFFAIAQALFLREKTWHLQNSFFVISWCWIYSFQKQNKKKLDVKSDYVKSCQPGSKVCHTHIKNHVFKIIEE